MLYPDPKNPYVSLVNIFNPDYKTHPKFENATPVRGTILPGETLFLFSSMGHPVILAYNSDQFRLIFVHLQKDIFGMLRFGKHDCNLIHIVG